jgi:hypothetical protein
MRSLLTALLLPLLSLLLFACTSPAMTSQVTRPANLDTATTRLGDQGRFRVSYTSDLSPLAINKYHTWTLHVETPTGEAVTDAQLTVDGAMPEHNHGLPTQPQVTAALGNGDYRVEGMKFQMPGWWTVTVQVAAGGQQDTVTFNLVLD